MQRAWRKSITASRGTQTWWLTTSQLSSCSSIDPYLGGPLSNCRWKVRVITCRLGPTSVHEPRQKHNQMRASSQRVRITQHLTLTLFLTGGRKTSIFRAFACGNFHQFTCQFLFLAMSCEIWPTVKCVFMSRVAFFFRAGVIGVWFDGEREMPHISLLLSETVPLRWWMTSKFLLLGLCYINDVRRSNRNFSVKAFLENFQKLSKQLKFIKSQLQTFWRLPIVSM